MSTEEKLKHFEIKLKEAKKEIRWLKKLLAKLTPQEPKKKTPGFFDKMIVCRGDIDEGSKK